MPRHIPTFIPCLRATTIATLLTTALTAVLIAAAPATAPSSTASSAPAAAPVFDHPRTVDDFLNLPPLTVAFQNLPVEQAIESLNAAAGIRIGMKGDLPGSVSVDAKGQPFWEVVNALQPQPSVTRIEVDGTWRLALATGTNGLRIGNAQAFGPLLVIPRQFKYELSSNPWRTDEYHAMARYSLELGLFFDPRIMLLGGTFDTIEILEITDDTGRKIPTPRYASNFNGEIRFNEPDPPPRSVNFKCQALARAYFPQDIAVLDLSELKSGHMISFSTGRYIVNDFKMTDDELTIKMDAQTFPGGQLRFYLYFYDATGKGLYPVEGRSARLSFKDLAQTYRMGRPTRLVFYDPDPVHLNVPFPFELKGVPLP
jgi:hypothetical protein